MTCSQILLQKQNRKYLLDKIRVGGVDVTALIIILFHTHTVILCQQPASDALSRSTSAKQRVLPRLRLCVPGCQHPFEASVTHAVWYHQPGNSLSYDTIHLLFFFFFIKSRYSGKSRNLTFLPAATVQGREPQKPQRFLSQHIRISLFLTTGWFFFCFFFLPCLHFRCKSLVSVRVW